MAVAAAAFFSLTWIASSSLICPPRRPLQDYHLEILAKPRDHGLQVQAFSVRSQDGYDTPCLLCEPIATPGPAAKGNKLRADLQAQGMTLAPWGSIRATLVLLHGHKGRKEDYLPIAERFCAVGFRCLLVDLPGHGDHPAPFACFGAHESDLPGRVLQEAARQFHFSPTPAALFGISQGGAIALQAAARPQENWYAVGELSGFATLDEVIAGQAATYFGPLRAPARATVRWLVEHRAGFDTGAVRPIDAAARLSTQAVLIGHGDADAFILPAQAQQLWQVLPASRKQFLNIPGAGHNDVLITPAPVYATLSRFFLDALPLSTR